MERAWAARRHSYPSPQQFPQRSPGNQRQFPGFRDGGAPAQHGITLALDGVQNLLSAAAEQFDVYREFAINLPCQGQALLKPLARARSTSNRIISQNAGVLRAAEMSASVAP